MPTPLELARQLARHWAERTAMDPWRFAEPGDATPANIYAGAMPPRSERLTPAASITVQPATAPAPNIAVRAIGLDIVAAAPTAEAAMAVLMDLHEVLFPALAPFTEPESESGAPAGLIGSPTLEAGQEAGVWLVVTLEHVDGPTDLGGRPSDQRGEDGQRLAAMSLEALVVPYTVSGV